MLNQKPESMDWLILTYILLDSLYTKIVQDIRLGNPYNLKTTGFAFDYISICVFQEKKVSSNIVKLLFITQAKVFFRHLIEFPNSISSRLLISVAHRKLSRFLVVMKTIIYKLVLIYESNSFFPWEQKSVMTKIFYSLGPKNTFDATFQSRKIAVTLLTCLWFTDLMTVMKIEP